MATSIPVTISFKAEVDQNLQKVFQMLSKLSSVAGQDAKTASKTFAQLAKEVEEVAKTAANAARELDKVSKRPAPRPAESRKPSSQTKPFSTSAPEAPKTNLRDQAAKDLQYALREEAKYLSAVQQSAALQAAAVRKAEADKTSARRKAGSELQAALREEAKSTQAKANAERAAAKETEKAALISVVALREVSDSLQEIGGPAAQHLKGLSDILFGLASKAAQTAREFEVYEAQLKTVLGTQTQAAAAFDFAKSFAVATPFDVKEITESTVTLETYGQRAQEVLPLVASLAAGMNKELGYTSLVVGKAMTGSLEGFESLRNEFGISTRELVKYGAEANKAGGLMVQTSGQIDKARQALEKIIKLRFGDALADRAKTVSAAISNAGDALINFSADVGEGVTPFVRFGAVLTEKVFSALAGLPGLMKAGLGVTAALGAGITGLGAVALTTTVALFRLDLELKKIVASNTAAAAATGLTSAQMGIMGATSAVASTGAATTTAALNTMGHAANFAGKAFTFLTRTPIGIALTAASIAGTAAYAALNAYANAQEAAGRKVADVSQILTKLTFTARDLTSALRDLGGEEIKLALSHKTLGERSAALAEAIKKIPAGELAARLKGMNLGPEELKGLLAAVKDQATALKAEIQDLMKYRDGLTLSTMGWDDGKLEMTGIKARFEEIDQKIRDATNSLKLLGNVTAIFAPVNNVVTEATAKFEGLAKSSQRALDFNRYASQAGGQNALRKSLADIQAQIDANNEGLASKGHSGGKDGILADLRSGNHDDNLKKLMESQLDLYQTLEQGEEKLASLQSQAGEKRLSDIEKNLAREKAVREVSRDEELAAIDKAIAAARDLGERGLDDETRLLEQKKSRKADWDKEDLESTKSALDQQLAVSKAFVERLNTEGKPQGEIVAAYDRMIAKLKEWQTAHGPLLATNKELAQEVSQTMKGLVSEKAAAQTKLLETNLKALKDSLQAIGNETESNATKLGKSVTNAQRLEVVERQIDLAKKAQTSSSYKVGEVDKVLTDLAKERLALEQTITQAKLRQAGDMQKLAMEGLQKEIELLELRREQGFNVDAQLMAKSAELREARIKDLELTYQAEREAADDKLAVEQKFQLARTNLEKDFTIEAQRQADKRVDIAKGEQTKRRRADSGSSSPQQTTSSGSAPRTSEDSSSGATAGSASVSPFILGKGFQLRQRNEEAKEAQRAAFAQGNSAAAGMVAQQDAERAARVQKSLDDKRKQNAAATDARQQDAASRQQAAEAAQNRYQRFDAVTRGIPGRPMTDDEYSRLMELRKPGGVPQAGGFSLPAVPDALRAASPKQLLQSNPQAPPVKGAEGKTQTVSNNQSYTANISVDGVEVANLAADPRFKAEVIRVVEDEFRRQGYRDGGAGWV